MNLRALTEISATRNLTLECAAFHDNTFYSSKIALNGLRLQYPRPEIHHGLSNRGLQVASVSLPRGWPQMMIVWSTQSQSIQINSTGLHWQQLNLNNPTTDIVIPPGHNLSLRWGPTVVSCLLSAENCTPENLELEFSWFQHYN